ncbi:hypothetical protein ColKHC_00255 [Colletotrichum higginsianum]|nr:hypothetical protein ColKHC_00255 [Colletotrichum higginsianum]
MPNDELQVTAEAFDVKDATTDPPPRTWGRHVVRRVDAVSRAPTTKPESFSSEVEMSSAWAGASNFRQCYAK